MTASYLFMFTMKKWDGKIKLSHLRRVVFRQQDLDRF